MELQWMRIKLLLGHPREVQASHSKHIREVTEYVHVYVCVLPGLYHDTMIP